ncbi:MAG: hypothetical protein GY841_03000 [FCB group bacterium]|nr:hypothetical protein [FCB group bacterium]
MMKEPDLGQPPAKRHKRHEFSGTTLYLKRSNLFIIHHGASLNAPFGQAAIGANIREVFQPSFNSDSNH